MQENGLLKKKDIEVIVENEVKGRKVLNRICSKKKKKMNIGQNGAKGRKNNIQRKIWGKKVYLPKPPKQDKIIPDQRGEQGIKKVSKKLNGKSLLSARPYAYWPGRGKAICDEDRN